MKSKMRKAAGAARTVSAKHSSDVSAPAAAGRLASGAALRVGVLGLGTVGTGVAEILSRHSDLIEQRTGIRLEIVRAFVRRRARKRQGAAASVQVTTRADAVVAAPDVDIVVELMGGIEPARTLILQALRSGKSVVTANKAVMALHGHEIFRTAAEHGADVYFEAAVAGGIPIIRTLREGLASDRITQIRGILNGTTNFMLSRMSRGDAYAGALAEAQRLGFAEADPTLDVSGRDAADKLAILIQLAFGTSAKPQEIPTEGITALTPDLIAAARELGYTIKLLAVGKRVQVGRREWLDARVHPAFVPSGHVLSTVPDNQNAIAVHSDALGYSYYQGFGAGGMPTGSAVVSDLIEAARNLRAGVHGRVALVRAASAPALIDPDDAVSAFFLRFLVDEKPGVMAGIARVLASHKISLATVLQRERADGDSPVPMTLTTHPARFGAMRKALASISKLGVLHAPAVVVRIEA